MDIALCGENGILGNQWAESLSAFLLHFLRELRTRFLGDREGTSDDS